MAACAYPPGAAEQRELLGCAIQRRLAAAACQWRQPGRWRAAAATELRDSGKWMAGRAAAGATCASTAIAKGCRCRWWRRYTVLVMPPPSCSREHNGELSVSAWKKSGDIWVCDHHPPQLSCGRLSYEGEEAPLRSHPVRGSVRALKCEVGTAGDAEGVVRPRSEHCVG